MSRIQHGMRYLSTFGLRYTLRRSREKLSERLFHCWARRWKSSVSASEAELAFQREHQPKGEIISVLIPVYNPPLDFLRDLIEALRRQTFRNWEACFCNAGDQTAVRELLDQAQGEDPRIRVHHSSTNAGISGNTNQALAMARGEWVVLCDHDDLLPPDALWRLAEAIEKRSPDMIYTDEDKVTQDGRWHTDPHFKPDFCPDNLRSGNYICHLLAARRKLVEQAGGLRSAYDGSQDHDLALRLSELTDRIVHLPFISYHWRSVQSSMSHQHLERCLDASCRAVEDHLQRLGWPAQVTAEDGILRLRYQLRPLTGAVLITAEDERSAHKKAFELQSVLPTGVGIRFVLPESEDAWYASVNQAVAESTEDLLLLVDVSVSRFSKGFYDELAMFAQREDVGFVTPQLTDRRGRITHAGFAVGLAGGLQCRNHGLPGKAAGWHLLNRQSHNVGAVSPACCMFRREAWQPLDPAYRPAFGLADLCLRLTRSELWHVYTPHARAVCTRKDLLVTGRARAADDLQRFEQSWKGWQDPCWNPGFSGKHADFSVRED